MVKLATLLSPSSLEAIKTQVFKPFVLKQTNRRQLREDDYKAFLAKHTVRFQRELIELFNSQEEEMLSSDAGKFNRDYWDNKFREEYAIYAKPAYAENGERVWNELLAALKDQPKSFKKEETPPDFEIGTSFDVDQTDVNKFIEEASYEFSDSVNDYTEERLKAILKESAEKGWSVEETADAIEKFFKGSRARAEMIAQTEMARAAVNGAIASYEQSGVVVGKEWVTAGDEQVCPYCSAMDARYETLQGNYYNRGQSLEADGGTLTFGYSSVPGPPLHPRCRCDILPVINEQYSSYFDSMI